MKSPTSTFLRKTIPLRKAVRDRFVFNFRQTYVMCVIFLIVLGVYYVWVLNANANSGYRARYLEEQRKSLETEKNLLKVFIAKQESLDELYSHKDGLIPIQPDEKLYFIVDNNL